ncbi:phage tail tape measure protein [uncultured Salegentibacter sp.]|uniref:phage tail tape measure protein n=1 Tax=uncultured Salegentibacter sp. TaxID=259320 RepID=UPI0025974890|nr:phage tail tape measure protein [uncultured Salegentibacter sp.]
MSDSINTIVDKQAYRELQELEDRLSSTNKAFINLYKSSQDLSKQKLNLEVPDQFERSLKKSTELTKQLNAHQKESERINKALASAQAKFYSAQSGTNKQLHQTRLETNILNKEFKENAILNSTLTGAYKKLSTELNQARRRAKDLAAEFGEDSTQAKKAAAEVRNLDNRLKYIDASVGQHQRNVGNYQSALGNLHPAFDRINMGLEGMGTNLDEISKNKNPFKALTTGIINFGKATLTFLLSPVGLAITALGSLFMLIQRNKDTVIGFDSELRNVGKTTGLMGAELEGLGNDIIKLSRNLQTVGTPALLEYATVAGQLGVKGRENILAFAEGLAKLETASNISGEEGAAQIARLLTLTDGGVQNIQDFGDEIVELGNNFAATESEILSNATAIAQNTGQYKFGRRDVLAYATATKAVGIEAEITGSTIGRSLGQFEKAIRTGKNLETILTLTGQSAEELGVNFKENSAGVFTDFIIGLSKIDKAGGSVNEQLENIGIVAIRDQRVLASLATGGFNTLEKAIKDVTTASGALDEEFSAASQKLDNQLNRVGIAWDNLVLSIENGQGIFGKFFAFLAGTAATALEHINRNVTILSATWGGLTSMVKQIRDEFIQLFETISKFGDIEIDFLNPGKMAESAKKVIGEIKQQLSGEAAKNIGYAFKEGFEDTISKISAEKALEEIAKSVNANPDKKDTEPEDPEKYNAGSIKAIEASISALEDQRDKYATTKEEVQDYNKAIAHLTRKLEEIQGKTFSVGSIGGPVNDIQKIGTSEMETPEDTSELEIYQYEKTEKAKTDILREQEDTRRQLVADTFSQFAEFYGIDFSAFENLITKKTELTQEDYVDAAASAATTILNMTRQRYDDEIAIARENMDRVLNNEYATEQQKEEAREEFRKKEKELKRKQAEEEKRAALFQIAINTAVAISKAIPNPLAIALAAGLGAAQAAFVAAQPIPRFKDGHLLGTYEGPAIVNDAPGNNYREVIEHKDGSLSLPTKRNQLINMDKGDKVHKNYESFFGDIADIVNYDEVRKASVMQDLEYKFALNNTAIPDRDFQKIIMDNSSKMESAIKKGFSNVKMINNNNNSELVLELRNKRLADNM